MRNSVRYSILSTLAITMSSSNQPRKFSPSRLLAYWPRLISPVSWWHCFVLLYHPSAFDKESQVNQSTRSTYSSWKSCFYIFIHLFLLVLVGLWCYIYWMITFDAGQYLTLLSNISSNRSNITDGKHHFDQLLWRTALKTFFISVDFGLINACAVTLAAFWRQRLSNQFYNLIFRYDLFVTLLSSHFDIAHL